MSEMTNYQRLATAKGLLESVDTSDWDMFDTADRAGAIENIERLMGEAGPEPNPEPAPGCVPASEKTEVSDGE